MAQLLRLLVQTFVDNTTMRGFGKLSRTPHAILRVLWSVYIVSMLTLLLVSAYMLVTEYTSFHTTVQSSENLHDPTEFPSITVCSQSPIGSEAVQLWLNGSVMSPGELNKRLRQGMLKAYEEGKLGTATDIFFADRLSTYFQNIPLRLLRAVGMRQEEMIIFCIMRHSRNNNPSVSHDEACNMNVRWVRHPQYANCYDITIAKSESPQVSSVSLVLQGGHLPAGGSIPMDSHVQDLFTQSLGLRITLHDPGTFPDIDGKGVSVGLGKLTEIKYQVVKNKKLNLGSDMRTCKSSSELQHMRLLDYTEWYDYTYKACISEELGEIILEACGCISAFHFIDKMPNETHPFCHYFGPDGMLQLERRLHCVRNVQIPEKIDAIRASTCATRCEYNEYPLQVSSTNWLPTEWQMRFAVAITRAWNTLDALKHDTNSTVVQEARRDALEFMTSNNLSHVHADSHLNLSRMSLVTVSRLSYSSISKAETQQITLSALFSRIGGIGSLTIGCTLALFFELFELAFLFSLRLASQPKKSTDGGEEAEHQMDGAELALKEEAD